MFTEKHFPEYITGEELDGYLDRAWYRMGQAVFTCHFLFFGDNLYSSIWIRLPLKNYAFRKKLRKIRNKCDREFTCEIKPHTLTPEKERLYQKYRINFKGMLSATLRESLNDNSFLNIYHTHEICVYDGGKLIAISFFDIGHKSIASIKGIYDPEYAGYSLGFYTMLKEIEYGLANDFEYYYPGYIVPGYPRFDYKLKIGRKDQVEYYDLAARAWKNYLLFSPEKTPVETMGKKLIVLGNELSSAGISGEILFYPAYEAKVFGYAGGKILESPLFLNCFNNVFPRPHFIVFYDLWKEAYIFCHCMPKEDYGLYFEFTMRYDNERANHFLDFIFQKSVIVETGDLKKLTAIINAISKLLKPPAHFQHLMG